MNLWVVFCQLFIEARTSITLILRSNCLSSGLLSVVWDNSVSTPTLTSALSLLQSRVKSGYVSACSSLIGSFCRWFPSLHGTVAHITSHYVHTYCIYTALCLNKSVETKNNRSERQMFVIPKHKLITFLSVSQGQVACLLLVCTIILQVYSSPLEDSTCQQTAADDRYNPNGKHWP